LRAHPDKRGKIVAFADDPYRFGQTQRRALRRSSGRRRAREAVRSRAGRGGNAVPVTSVRMRRGSALGEMIVRELI
jgi:hypothetical protein